MLTKVPNIVLLTGFEWSDGNNSLFSVLKREDVVLFNVTHNS